MQRSTTAAGRTAVTTSTDPGPVETYLRRIVERVPRDEIPMIDELVEADLGTPTGSASIARAAICWLRHKSPSTIADDLRAELADADDLAVLRTRSAWADFEHALRSFRRGRGPVVSHDELQRRRAEVIRPDG